MQSVLNQGPEEHEKNMTARELLTELIKLTPAQLDAVVVDVAQLRSYRRSTNMRSNHMTAQELLDKLSALTPDHLQMIALASDKTEVTNLEPIVLNGADFILIY